MNMPSNDDGARAIGRAVASHPTFAMAMFGGLVGAVIAGASAYSSVTNQLTQHTKDIADVKGQVVDNERRSSDKLDRLGSDMGELKVQMSGISSSLQFLVRQSPRGQPDPR